VGASTGHTDENETIAALQAQIAELQERVRIADAVAMRAVELESTLQQRDEQLRQCAARNEAMRAVLASTALDPADKVIGLAALTHMNAREGSERHTDPEKGTRVNMQVISRLSGMSSDTVGKRVQKLAEGGLWERSESSWRDPDGGPPITNVWLKADGSLVERTEALAAVALKRTHGGVRVKVLCDVCGSEDVHRISHKECNGCGHKWGAETTPLNPPQPAAACEPQDAALNYTTICEPQDAARDTSTVEAPQAKRVPVVHFQPEPGEGIEEIDIWQGAQPPPNTAICRRVFGQECFAPGCKHQPRYIPVGAG
jgi:hypothetical protein